jgi:hypothetical protein
MILTPLRSKPPIAEYPKGEAWHHRSTEKMHAQCYGSNWLPTKKAQQCGAGPGAFCSDN